MNRRKNNTHKLETCFYFSTKQFGQYINSLLISYKDPSALPIWFWLHWLDLNCPHCWELQVKILLYYNTFPTLNVNTVRHSWWKQQRRNTISECLVPKISLHTTIAGAVLISSNHFVITSAVIFQISPITFEFMLLEQKTPNKTNWK